MQPKVVLFDEVTSVLDPQLTGEVLRVIERLAEDGMTMVMVTHEMNFARKIADQVVFMHHGKVWEIGPASVLDNPQTEELRDFLAHEL
jgi:polar amino acid transport system ATP-binding protein